ncbi:hypothetical protein CTEN210_09681 [Chaetoceros tenuissimus]|uniref:Uncharacterized protein n=1 Tax=Chaetoceros tenuissimus TaxID=426638 RepID=A0AAD3CY94_9STRA|nr:hypothetical protein CTEN210_09681 [Chaetoceros tenuissimus]
MNIGNASSPDYQVKKMLRPIQNLVQLNSIKSFILPSIVYASRKNRASKIVLVDVPWSVLFKNTTHVQSEIKNENFEKAKNLGLSANNDHPKEYWRERPLRTYRGTRTVLDRYQHRDMFYSPKLIAVIHQLQVAMTPLVLSYFESIRAQLNPERIDDHVHEKEVSICFHLRQGNNETGDWQGKKWRHVNTDLVLNMTLSGMKSFVESRDASKATLFIASDNGKTIPWFESRISNSWTIVKPAKSMPKPENGVWFGQHGSKTSDVLNQTGKNEAMAEALSDIFALAECDALFIPNYSSFTYVSIALTRARGNSVLFLGKDKYHNMTDFEDGTEMKT